VKSVPSVVKSLHRRASPAAAASLAVALAVATPATAQFGSPVPSSRYELSPAVQVDRAEDTVVRSLQRAKALLADKKWPEAIDTLSQVMEQSGSKLIAVTDRRFVSVRDYCHLQFVLLPPEALRLYRSRVDLQAKRLYEEGVALRDRRPLLTLLDQAFASTWGARALDGLAEMALESGDPAAARAYWEKIVPLDQPADVPRTWLGVPDTDLDLAGIRARLVLASILEGSLGRARDELARLAKSHPDARGRFGGQETNCAAALKSLLAESATWPQPRSSPDWATFAGSPLRNRIAAKPPDVRQVAWRARLWPAPRSDRSLFGPPPVPRRLVDDPRTPLSYHPVIVGDLVLVNTQSAVLALDRQTGKPAWGAQSPAIYEDPYDEAARQRYNPAYSLGIPRFTMSVANGKVCARMGPSWTGRPADSRPGIPTGYLVCLDLAAQGQLVERIQPDEGFAFEGSPVCDGSYLYVAMRRSQVQSELHVACYDPLTGQRRWRQLVCSADTPARGVYWETSHNLLTLHRDTLYCNTNLGAVAALAARDGRVLWVTLYPRALKGDLQRPAPHASRDLTPCLYDRGTLVVAPADSPEVFALDAATGQALWHTGLGAEGIVHLLGVAGDTLIAGGARLYWIGLGGPNPGRIRRVWPEGAEKLGYGRGLLAGDCVLWPTREKIYVLDQQTGRLRKEIDLLPRGVTGGNLLVAGDQLLIATGTELVALGQGGKPPTSLKDRDVAISFPQSAFSNRVSAF
jgi:outer membrane protein assembly factor BamB